MRCLHDSFTLMFSVLILFMCIVAFILSKGAPFGWAMMSGLSVGWALVMLIGRMETRHRDAIGNQESPARMDRKTFLRQGDILHSSDTMVEVTVEELAGFITGNVKRKQVVDVLDKNGSETFETIEKTTRTPKLMLEKTLKDLTDRGIIKKQKDKYALTDNGLAAVTVLHSMR